MHKKSKLPFPSPEDLFYSVHAVIGVLEKNQRFFVDSPNRERVEFREMSDLRRVIHVLRAAFESKIPKTKEGQLILTALRKAARESSDSLHSWEWAVSALTEFADGPKVPIVDMSRLRDNKERVHEENRYDTREELVVYLAFIRKTLIEAVKL